MASIELQDWIKIVSCAGHLALATLALLRISKNPLGLPLGLLCLDLFVFNGADAVAHITGVPEWGWLDAAGTSLLPPLAMRFVLTFVGRNRTHRWLAWVFDVYFGAIAIACALAFFGVSWSQTYAGKEAWGWTMTPGAIALVVADTWLLAGHLRDSESPLERARTWLVISATTLGVVGNFADLFTILGFSALRLGPLSLLLTTLVLALAVLRLGLFETRISWLIAANALVLGALQVIGYFAVFYFFGGNPALVAVGIGTLTLGLVPVLVAVTRAAAAGRAQLEYHATLGRFSAQMAHDIRNPLAAIKGAAQYLQVEESRGKLTGAKDYLALIVEQTERLDRTIQDYQRLGRTEVVLKVLNLNALVEEVLSGQVLAVPVGIQLERKLDARSLECSADADLLSAALENLVRNAFEAMPAGGTVTVVTELPASDQGFLWLSVADTGPGMNPRLLERVRRGQNTTKATGSGMGLAFVRRVAEAHGGRATIESAEGKGTVVRMRLKIAAPAV